MTHGRSSGLVAVAVLAILAIPIPTFTGYAEADMGNIQKFYNQTAPAFGTQITIPSNVELRFVYGTWTIGASAVQPAEMNIFKCPVVNQAARIQAITRPSAQGTAVFSYSFTMAGGDCYQFNNTANPASVNSISSYHYIDVMNESFEGQAHANSTWESQTHANATWCPYSCVATAENHANATFCYRSTDQDLGCAGNRYANATWEGQGHANSTWCALTFCESQPHANATWCALTSCESQAHANSTWESQQHANATWESQPHANATWCPLSGVGCAGSSGGSGNFSGNFTGNVTIPESGSLDGVLSYDWTQPFFANISLAKFVIMIFAFAAFIWVSRMHWYEMAAWSWLIIIQQLFLGDTPFGQHATFIGLVVLWLVNLFMRVILSWRDELRQGRASREARPNRGRGG